jgi:hypothetical protein
MGKDLSTFFVPRIWDPENINQGKKPVVYVTNTSPQITNVQFSLAAFHMAIIVSQQVGAKL